MTNFGTLAAAMQAGFMLGAPKAHWWTKVRDTPNTEKAWLTSGMRHQLAYSGLVGSAGCSKMSVTPFAAGK